MSPRRVLPFLVLALVTSLVPLRAQDPPAPPPKQGYQNVRIDVTISLKGEAKPITKTLSMVATDRRLAKGRAGIEIPVPTQPVVMTPTSVPLNTGFNYRSVGLNVDATPEILDASRVLLRLNWNFSTVYKPESAGSMPPSFGAGSNEVMGIVFESGKPVIVAQAADGETGREYTVQVTATILK